jgi:hypothetical protein
MNDVLLQVTLRTQTCCYSDCGIVFAVPLPWDDQRRRDHKWFYCPNGHKQQYTSKSVEEKAREEAESAKRNAEYWENRMRAEVASHLKTERSRRATAGHLHRMKARVGHGVCPCCNRTFANLVRHMNGQHPGFAQEKP